MSLCPSWQNEEQVGAHVNIIKHRAQPLFDTARKVVKGQTNRTEDSLRAPCQRAILERCAAAHLLKASVSCAMMKVRSSSVWPTTSSLTGALKFLSSEDTGLASTPDSTNSFVAESASSTALLSSPWRANLPSETVNVISRPSGPSSPTEMGISTGTLSAWSFVGAVTCLVVTLYVLAAALYSVEMVRLGVPAWPYLHDQNTVAPKPVHCFSGNSDFQLPQQSVKGHTPTPAGTSLSP